MLLYRQNTGEVQEGLIMDATYSLAMTQQSKAPILACIFPQGEFGDENYEFLKRLTEAINLVRLAGQCQLILFFPQWVKHDPKGLSDTARARIQPLLEAVGGVEIQDMKLASRQELVVIFTSQI